MRFSYQRRLHHHGPGQRPRLIGPIPIDDFACLRTGDLLFPDIAQIQMLPQTCPHRFAGKEKPSAEDNEAVVALSEPLPSPLEYTPHHSGEIAAFFHEFLDPFTLNKLLQIHIDDILTKEGLQPTQTLPKLQQIHRCDLSADPARQSIAGMGVLPRQQCDHLSGDAGGLQGPLQWGLQFQKRQNRQIEPFEMILQKLQAQGDLANLLGLVTDLQPLEAPLQGPDRRDQMGMTADTANPWIDT